MYIPWNLVLGDHLPVTTEGQPTLKFLDYIRLKIESGSSYHVLVLSTGATQVPVCCRLKTCRKPSSSQNVQGMH